MRLEFYRCDPEKNTICSKRDCQTLCFHTTYKQYRKGGNSMFKHYNVSLLKSAVRISSCIWAGVTGSVSILAAGFLVAEVLGIVEEIVDKRPEV